PPGSTLCPYTTLFRSWPGRGADRAAARGAVADRTRVPGPAAVAAGARAGRRDGARRPLRHRRRPGAAGDSVSAWRVRVVSPGIADRKSTRLNSSHVKI